MAAWRRSSSASSFMVPCREQLESRNCYSPHCTPRFTNRPGSVPGAGERPRWPFPSLGKCLAGDASPTLCACFLTRCKFFLFRTLTFPQLSVSSCSFVRGARRAHSGATKRGRRGEPEQPKTSPMPGFSLEQGQDLEHMGGREAHHKPGTASFFGWPKKKKKKKKLVLLCLCDPL